MSDKNREVNSVAIPSMEHSGAIPAMRHHVRRLVLTYVIGAVMLIVPLGSMIEGFAIANNYAGNPDPTSQGHVSEAMFQAGLAGTLGAIFLLASMIVAGIIARNARLNVLVATLGGAILVVLVTLPISWLLFQPVGGAWLG